MIIFINGAFGVGKTACAEAIVKRLPASMLYDPEEVGFMLREILKPIGVTGDFQDFAAWRPLVATVAKELKSAYRDTLVVPMTIRREDYFREVTGGLRRIDPDFHHFCLTAPSETIHQRLEQRARQEGREPDAWALQQTEKCVRAFASSLFDERIDAGEKAPEEIASYILNRVQHSSSGRCS